MTNLEGKHLSDGFGRKISYLRLSVTDRCNLRCVYCVKENPSFIHHTDILRYEELMRLVELSRKIGVEKVRLTGGEPLVRKGFTGFVRELNDRFPGMDLRITTNGTLLTKHLPGLLAAGVKRVNISLDTLDRDEFARVTGRDMLGAVLEAIDYCLDRSMAVKINVVAMREVNGGQLPAFFDFMKTRPVDIRFIELMPMGTGNTRFNTSFLSAKEILENAERLATLTPIPRREANAGPAKVFNVAGHAGRLGLITPISSHFCADCNRLRITSDGRLRTCLFSDKTYALKPLLRHPRLGADKCLEVMRRALAAKPMGSALLSARREGAGICGTGMSSIGG